MHDAIFAHNRNLSDDFTDSARQSDLDLEAFNACMSEERLRGAIEKDVKDAAELAISGTPTFLIGLTQPGENQITVVRSCASRAVNNSNKCSTPFSESQRAAN
jgi:predicted DsbA family dithiol-disulfide isomerase